MKNFVYFALVAILVLYSAGSAIAQNHTLITKDSVGIVKIGMTVDELREAVKPLKLSEGVKGHALSREYSVKCGNETFLTFVENAGAIRTIEVWDASYQTAEGIRVGASLSDLESKYGKLRSIELGEQDDFESATFTNHPNGIEFRLAVKTKNGTAGIYEEVDGEPAYKTSDYNPGVYLKSMQVWGGAENEDKASESTGNLITKDFAGNVKIGMTVEALRKELKSVNDSRKEASNPLIISEGVAGFEGERDYTVKSGKELVMTFVENIGAIRSIEVWDAGYRTADGVHTGMSISDLEMKYGKLKELEISDQDDHEYATFTNHPQGISLRVALKGKKGFVGIYNLDVSYRTTEYNPGAHLLTMQIPGGPYVEDEAETDEITVSDNGENQKPSDR